MTIQVQIITRAASGSDATASFTVRFSDETSKASPTLRSQEIADVVKYFAEDAVEAAALLTRLTPKSE